MQFYERLLSGTAPAAFVSVSSDTHIYECVFVPLFRRWQKRKVTVKSEAKRKLVKCVKIKNRVVLHKVVCKFYNFNNNSVKIYAVPKSMLCYYFNIIFMGHTINFYILWQLCSLGVEATLDAH